MPKKRSCQRCASIDTRRSDKFKRLRNKLGQTLGELDEAHELLKGKKRQVGRIVELEKQLKETMAQMIKMKENSEQEVETYQKDVGQLGKELQTTKEKLENTNSLLAQIHHDKISLKQQLDDIREELEEKGIQFQENLAERENLIHINNALTLQLDELSAKVNALKSESEKAEKQNIAIVTSDSPSNASNHRFTPTPVAGPHQIRRTPIVSPSKSPLPKIIQKGTKLATESVLKGCIQFAVPNFRDLASKCEESTVCSESVCLAGFRWALRVKIHKKETGAPRMLSLWLWAKGPEDGKAHRQWDVTAQMTFRVKRQHSPVDCEQKQQLSSSSSHITRNSLPSTFTNRVVPLRTIIGFKMAELNILADLRNGFVSDQGNLCVEVDFGIKRTSYTLQ